MRERSPLSGETDGFFAAPARIYEVTMFIDLIAETRSLVSRIPLPALKGGCAGSFNCHRACTVAAVGGGPLGGNGWGPTDAAT